MEKFQEVFVEWQEVNDKLYIESKKYIVNVLENQPDKTIDIDENHLFSTLGGDVVYGVYLIDDKVYFNTEFGEVGAETGDEMFWAAQAIYQTINNK